MLDFRAARVDDERGTNNASLRRKMNKAPARLALVYLAIAAVPAACGGGGVNDRDASSGGAPGVAGSGGAGTGGRGPGGAPDAGAAGQAGRGGTLGTAGAAGLTGGGGTMGIAGASGRSGGGAGGVAGNDGTGGLGGGSGSGVGGTAGSGQPLPCDTSWPISCTTTNAVCGNGTRDTCMAPAGLGPGCPIVTMGELCDGNNVGTATCQQQGFGSGTLTCLSSCNGFDVSRCSDCAVGPAVLRCGPVAMSAAPLSAAIDASDTEIGVAWVEQVGYGQAPKLWFARLAPNLDVIDAAQIADSAVATEIYAQNQYAVPVAVAPLPSGWVVAGHADVQLFLHAFNGAGNHVSRIVLDDDEETAWPLLASRPNGGPLVVWTTDAGVRAAVVSNDGLTTTVPINIHTTGQEFASAASVAFGGDVFYVLLEVRTDTSEPWMRWARVSTAGALLGFTDAPKNLNFGNPSLVTGGNGLRIVFETWITNSYDPVRIVVQPFNPMTGAALSPARTAATYEQEYTNGKGAAFGDDTFFALSGPYGGLFGATRLAPSGAVVTPIYPVAVGREIYWYAVAKRGPDAIVAWTGNPQGPLKIARLVP